MLFLEPPPFPPVKSPSPPSPIQLLSEAAPSPTQSSGGAIYLHRVCIFHFSFFIFHLFRLRLQAATAAPYRVTPYEVPKGTSAGRQPPHQYRTPEKRFIFAAFYFSFFNFHSHLFHLSFYFHYLCTAINARVRAYFRSANEIL